MNWKVAAICLLAMAVLAVIYVLTWCVLALILMSAVFVLSLWYTVDWQD